MTLGAETEDIKHGHSIAVFYSHGPPSITLIEYTPLHLAVLQQKLHIAKLLVDAGANVNALTGEKYSPMDLAIYNGNDEIFQILLDSNGKQNKPPNKVTEFYKEKLKEVESEKAKRANLDPPQSPAGQPADGEKE